MSTTGKFERAAAPEGKHGIKGSNDGREGIVSFALDDRVIDLLD